MRKFVWIWIIGLIGCGGKVSDEQRKAMREGMKDQTVQRVSDAELTETAFSLGRSIMKQVNSRDSLTTIDSIESASRVRVKWLTAGSADALEIERQVIDAYIMNAATGNDQPDNVQIVGDSILYTKPVVEEMADGAIYVKGTWNIWMSRKELVLSLNKQ